MRTKLIIGFCLTLALIAASRSFAVDPAPVKLDPKDTEKQVVWKAAHVVPSARQLAWSDLEFAAFLHFGMNTFTNREWGEGTESPATFNPTDFDARQWVKAIKDAGMLEVIITAKHHDGFCLWPTKYTDHSIKNSPWKDGKGDVVREVADAAREAGLKFGFYLSPWDRHDKRYGTSEYNEYYKNQLRELLTQYSDVAEVWMDGACGDTDPRCKTMKYDWDGIFGLIRELQPNAVMSIYGPDVRWVGNEAGQARASEWSVVPQSYDALSSDLGSREKLMAAAQRGETIRWYPSQTDTSIRPGWFYHKMEDFMVKPLDLMLDIYFGSVGGNSQLLLNIPPDKRGRITDFDVKRLKQLRRVIGDTFSENLAIGAKATASASAKGGHNGAETTIDNNPDTYWTTDDWVDAADVEYDLGAEKTFDVAMLREHIASGQRIEAFAVEAWDGKAWRPVASATTVGHKRLLRFSPVTARRVRVRIEKSRVAPTLGEFGLYLMKR